MTRGLVVLAGAIAAIVILVVVDWLVSLLPEDEDQDS